LPAPGPSSDPVTLQARATVDRFIDFLQHPWSTQEARRVLVQVQSAEGPQLIWLDYPHFDGRYIIGLLSREAPPAYPFSQAVQVLPSEIFDWVIGGPRIVCGFFTERQTWASEPLERAKALEFWEVPRLPHGDELCVEDDSVEEEGH
ncbi:MAG TPA: hypothetical protein VF771_03585, partial [Longimicrobiaceae bacterium]